MQGAAPERARSGRRRAEGARRRAEAADLRGHAAGKERRQRRVSAVCACAFDFEPRRRTSWGAPHQRFAPGSGAWLVTAARPAINFGIRVQLWADDGGGGGGGPAGLWGCPPRRLLLLVLPLPLLCFGTVHLHPTPAPTTI